MHGSSDGPFRRDETRWNCQELYKISYWGKWQMEIDLFIVKFGRFVNYLNLDNVKYVRG